MNSQRLDRVTPDDLRQQYDVATHDFELFDTIIRALEAMTPEGRLMALTRLTRLDGASPQTASPGASITVPISPSATHPTSVLCSVELSALTYADAVEFILNTMDRPRPMSTQFLIARLQTLGKQVKGKHAYATLYRSLTISRKFINIDGDWALVDWYAEDVGRLRVGNEPQTKNHKKTAVTKQRNKSNG